MKRTAASLALLLFCFTVASADPQRAVLDFDGDNKTDYALVRPVGTAEWNIHQSTDGYVRYSWGTTATDRFVPGDYDGDLKWDIVIWRPGTPSNFYILQSQTNTMRVVPYGTSADHPDITQDFDGDSIADPAVRRVVEGQPILWYVQRSQLGPMVVAFGAPGLDLPIHGDFDGDGKTDYAVWRDQGAFNVGDLVLD